MKTFRALCMSMTALWFIIGFGELMEHLRSVTDAEAGSDAMRALDMLDSIGLAFLSVLFVASLAYLFSCVENSVKKGKNGRA